MKKTYTSKKRIAVDAYFFNNFGDDLFLEILINRYPNAHFDFITPSEDRIKNFLGNPRIKIVSRKQALKNVMSYDLYIMIGGSMFQQPPNWKMQWLNLFLMVRTFKLFNKPCAIIGCNFGPYSNPSYLKSYKNIFKKLDYLSVRDEKSFNVLNDKNINIHCYPDIAFSFDVEPNNGDHRNKENIIGISIMDFGKENLYYEDKMAEILSRIQQDTKIKIFSFQNSNEINDLKVIKNVLSKINNNGDHIEVVNYEGNMNSFLSHYEECRAFLTTRFHSLILSLMYNQKIVAINYNPKIENTLKFLNLPIDMVNLDSLEDINLNILFDQKQTSYDLSKIKRESLAHFEFIDTVIGERNTLDVM
jgi:colanic acid/amylovoran biosynthesis protein